MAANHYRALMDTYAELWDLWPHQIMEYAERLRFAIGNAPAFMFIGHEAYTRIVEWCDKIINMEELMPTADDKEELRWILFEILPAIGQEWLELGKPITEGDWGRAKYPDIGEDNG